MASEITLNFGFSVVKSNLRQAVVSHNLVVDLTGSRFVANVQDVGTSHEALVVGDLSTAGYIWIKNLDPTNYVEIGILDSGTFYPTCKLKALREALFPAAVVALYAKANTSPCKLQYQFFED